MKPLEHLLFPSKSLLPSPGYLQEPLGICYCVLRKQILWASKRCLPFSFAPALIPFDDLAAEPLLEVPAEEGLRQGHPLVQPPPPSGTASGCCWGYGWRIMSKKPQHKQKPTQTPALIITGVMVGIMGWSPPWVKSLMPQRTECLTFIVIQGALGFQWLQRACEKTVYSVYSVRSPPSRSQGHRGGWIGLGGYQWQTMYYIKVYPALQWLRHLIEPNLVCKSHSAIRMGSPPKGYSILTHINISRAWPACLVYPNKPNCQWCSQSTPVMSH